MPPRSECFVYVQLPGALQPVVCGRFERARTRAGAAVGRFVYGRSYRERPDAVPLDPIHLASRENLVSQSPRFGLDEAEANGVIDEMKGIVARFWRTEVLRLGSARDCDVIEPAFVYPGFEYPSEA